MATDPVGEMRTAIEGAAVGINDAAKSTIEALKEASEALANQIRIECQENQSRAVIAAQAALSDGVRTPAENQIIDGLDNTCDGAYKDNRQALVNSLALAATNGEVASKTTGQKAADGLDNGIKDSVEVNADLKQKQEHSLGAKAEQENENKISPLSTRPGPPKPGG